MLASTTLGRVSRRLADGDPLNPQTPTPQGDPSHHDRPQHRPRPSSQGSPLLRPAAVVLDPPPAYLAEVPIAALTATSPKGDGSSVADRLLGALSRRGIAARPSLAEVEAERTRRGMRRGVVLGDAPAAPRRVVLPMGSAVSPIRRDAGVVYGSDVEALREEARRNRARIEAALGDLSEDPRAVARLGYDVAREIREERAA